MVNPFPGLRPFEANEDHLFFGREKEIDDLLRRLRAGRFLAIIGTSGCGKSSLVRSGLIPALGGGAMSDASSDWKIAIMRPGEDPIRHLARALSAPSALGGRGELGAAPNSVLIEATLRRGTRGLVEVVRQARIEKGANVLLLVDQFEELFRFRRNAQLENAHDESIAFVKSLLEAAEQRDFPIYVVLTMRSDFIGDCMGFTGLPEAVNDGLYLVPRMSRDEVRLAITGPVAVGGGKITQRLVLRLLNDFGDDINQLPVLQHALMRTWDHWQARDPKTDAIDIDDYEVIGTIKQALSIHAEEAYEEAGTPERKQIVEKVFKGLTDTFSDPRGIRRPTSVGDLTAMAEAPVTEVQSVIELFRKPGRSFLTPDPDVPLEDRCIVDVSHESLMRCWQRLRTWAEEERRAAEVYSRLSAAARWHEEGSAGLWRNPELEIALRWKEKNRPTQAWAQRYNQVFPLAMSFLEQSEAERTREDNEKRHERRRKLRQMQWTAGVLASLLLVTLVFAAIAIKQTRIARENLQTAMSAVDASLSTAGQQQAREAGDLPEIQAFRKDLLDKAATFYTQLAKQNKNSPEFLVEEARAHARLGDINGLMSRDADAAQEYSGAIDRFSKLVQRDPEKAEYRSSLAFVHDRMGYTISGALSKAATFGQYTRNDAEKEYSQAIALQEALHTEAPGNANYQRQLARTRYNRGINRYYAQNAEGAKADFLQAIALLEPLAQVATGAAKGTNREPAQDLARVYNNYAVVMAKAKDIKDAERYYDQSIALAEQLVARQPQNRYYKSELAQYAFNEARMEADNGQMEDADGHGKRALDLLDQLSKPTPALMFQLVETLQLEGQVWCVSDPKRGIALTDRALSTLRELDREGTQKAGSLDPLFTNIAINYQELGLSAIANKDRKTAQEALDRLQDAMPHLTDKERNSFTGPYEELHTALYKDRGKGSE